MRTALLAIVLAACGGSSSKSSTTPKADVTCAATADSMVTLMMQGREKKGIEDTVDGFTTIIRTRCEQDAWTAEARQCLSTMKSRDDAERCSTMLTDEQQANLVRDQKEKFGAPPKEEEKADAPKPEPTGAAPPPPAEAPAAPMKVDDTSKGVKTKSAPKDKKRTKGDPCDGGE